MVPFLFDGEIHVHYSQFYVESRGGDPFELETLGGQVNGLCGAAVPGKLFLTTGLHTGNVHLAVELLDAPPLLDDQWEDVVEVSFRPEGSLVDLVEWAGGASWPLALVQVDYRVRYCAIGMDTVRAKDTRLGGEPLLDRYLLQFWPAPPAPDAVVRQTSEIAAYWHAHARKQPRAAAERRGREERQRANKQTEVLRWRGRTPSERLKRINGSSVMVKLDGALVDRIQDLDENVQRAVGVWAARRACDEAGLSDLDWVAPALTALEHGEPLPKPFDNHTDPFELLQTGAPQTAVPSFDGRHDRVSQQHAAIPTLWSAAATDSLAAGLETLFHATVTFGDGYPRLLAEMRQAFPVL